MIAAITSPKKITKNLVHFRLEIGDLSIQCTLRVSNRTAAAMCAAKIGDVGKIASTLLAGTNLYTKAMSGDVTSMIFYLKTRGRWSEKAPVGDAENPLTMLLRQVSGTSLPGVKGDDDA